MGAPLKGRYSPVDPVAYGSPVPCPNPAEDVLSTVTGSNADLMAQVARLWIEPGDVVADVTYGKGVFWRKLPAIAETLRATDIKTGVDCRVLPYADESIDVVVFDPPYQPMHGTSRKFGVGESYALDDSGLHTVSDVLDLYEEGIGEAQRCLRHGGRLLVKCQDYTYNHRLHLMHLDVIRRMALCGIDLADMFVLFNTSRMPQPVPVQQRARRAHSYMLVGVKP